MNILRLQGKTHTHTHIVEWALCMIHSLGRRKNFFKTQHDQQQKKINKLIVVNLSPAAASQEANRPEAAPKTSKQRLTEPAEEPDAAVRDRKNGPRLGVCFL